ncbi:barstar family protein [Clostridium merdae]|uniref:barstar family protein n=1 Tax=Clostridium merdae TaxID=1958780 RepID=UPI00117D4E56|nr:barstar family protein [Clostridium merdae]
MSEKKTIVLDLTGCKNLWELHERIRIAFDFPEWYGKNWDAFWDLMWSDCEAEMVEIVGENTVQEEFLPEFELMHTVLSDVKKERKEFGWSFDYKIIS